MAPARPVDASALEVAATAEAELQNLALPLAVVTVGAERLGDAAHRMAIAAETPEPTPRSLALHAVATAHGAISRLRERAMGRPGMESVEHRARRVRETLDEVRARIAAVGT